MHLFDILTTKNFEHYALRNYNNPQCIEIEEFYEDLNRFKYIKKLLNRYLSRGELSTRLIRNHIIVLYNVFGIGPTIRMLKFKMDDEHWPVLKPFLIDLGLIDYTEFSHIKLDANIVQVLRNDV